MKIGELRGKYADVYEINIVADHIFARLSRR